MPYLSFAVICLLFGSNFILMSRANQALGPVAVGAGRLWGAAVVVLLVWRLVTPSARVPRSKLPACAVVGLLANAYPYAAQPLLISQGFGHSFFGMMVAFTPLLTVLMSIPLLGIRPTVREAIGVLAGLGFIGLMMWDGTDRGIAPWMLAVSITIPTAYAFANVYLRRELSDVPPNALSVALMAIPAVVLTPLAFATPVLQPLGLSGPSEPANWTSALLATAFLGVFGTGVTMWLFIRLVQQQGPLFAGMVTYVVPVVALMWGLVDAEPITTKQLVAIGGILGSVMLVQYGAAGKAKRQASTEQPARKNEELVCTASSQ